MTIAARLLAARLPRWAEERAFREAFYSDAHRKFKELGARTVRHLLEARGLDNELEYNAARLWLARHEHLEAWRNWALFALAAIGVALSIATLLFK